MRPLSRLLFLSALLLASVPAAADTVWLRCALLLRAEGVELSWAPLVILDEGGPRLTQKRYAVTTATAGGRLALRARGCLGPDLFLASARRHDGEPQAACRQVSAEYLIDPANGWVEAFVTLAGGTARRLPDPGSCTVARWES